MAKFSGMVGYGIATEMSPGVWEDVITEKQHFGEVIRNARRFQEGESVNNNLTVSNSITILADGFAGENFHAIRYVVWRGARWTVLAVEELRPRLILRLGGVYNGPTPVPSGP